jgi:hypothetical protein
MKTTDEMGTKPTAYPSVGQKELSKRPTVWSGRAEQQNARACACSDNNWHVYDLDAESKIILIQILEKKL